MKKSLNEVLVRFMARVAGQTFLAFIGAVYTALVLAYPVKWVWNGIAEHQLLFNPVEMLTFWKAFKIILVLRFIFSFQIDEPKPTNKE